jgi:hypothetical protein
MIKPLTQTLLDLFSDNTQYGVPVYQRPYVWTQDDHWQPLWEDVVERCERYRSGGDGATAHFLGAVVIEVNETGPGRVREYTVIDGQQRLTSLQLLVAAFHQVAKEHDHPTSADVRKLLHNTGRHATGDLKYKVWPSRTDRRAFRAALDLDGAAVSGEANHRLVSALEFFARQIREWVGTTGNDALGDLYDTLVGLLQVVSIQLDGSSDAQVVFETLNSRGADLTSLDLAKNALLRQASREGADVESLHDQHWEPALGDASYWFEQVRQGRYTRERADLFLSHWLTMKLGTPPRGQHLFADFRNKILRAVPSPPMVELLPELCRDASVLRSFDSLDPGTPEGRFFRRLDQMDTTTLLPVALLLFRSSDLGREPRRRALAALESWLVRRMLLGATTQHYNRLLSGLLGRLNAEASLAAADALILEALRRFDSAADRWPTDEEVAARLTGDRLYGWISQARIRMLLEACELDLGRESGAELVTLPSGLTIEHAMPQAWENAWRLPNGLPEEEARLEREARINRLGNLTLLTQKLNSAVSNGPWSTKRLELAQRSQLLINQHLCAHDSWDEAKIDQRSRELANRILRIWPGPEATW